MLGRKIIIAHKKLTQLLNYSPETGIFTWKDGVVAGEEDKRSHHLRIHVENVEYSAHRLAWFYVTEIWTTSFVSHINKVKTDNRFQNLRLESQPDFYVEHWLTFLKINEVKICSRPEILTKNSSISFGCPNCTSVRTSTLASMRRALRMRGNLKCMYCIRQAKGTQSKEVLKFLLKLPPYKEGERLTSRTVLSIPCEICGIELNLSVGRLRRQKFKLRKALFCRKCASKECNDRRADTNKKKYGSSCPLNNAEVRVKSLNTIRERYGHSHYLSSKIPQGSLAALQDLPFLKALHHDCGVTLQGIAKILKLKSPSLVSDYFRKHSLEVIGFKHSDLEVELRNFITTLYHGEIVYNNTSVLEGQELDIFIPPHSLAIEFNGIRWHSEYVNFGTGDIQLSKSKDYHLHKTLKCASKGIFLLHVWEDDWLFRKEQVKTRIRNLLNTSPKGVMARKTKVVGVGKDDACAFFLSHHVQGKCSSTRDLGLLDVGNELVAVMSFKSRKGEGVWELVRFASSKNVVGGFSKLLKFFQKNNEWTKIISFADRSWSKGDLYEKTGWVMDGVLAPDYKYVLGNRRVHKFNYRHAGGGMKKKLKHYCALLTERENMLGNGIYRIWDCGKLRYVISKS